MKGTTLRALAWRRDQVSALGASQRSASRSRQFRPLNTIQSHSPSSQGRASFIWKAERDGACRKRAASGIDSLVSDKFPGGKERDSRSTS